MPPRDEVADIVRIVVGVHGTVRMRGELALRFDYGHIVPWVRHDEHGIHAVAGPDSAYLVTPAPLRGERMHTVSDFTVTAGERVPFVLTWSPSHLGRPRCRGPGSSAGVHRGVLAGLVREVHDHRAAPRRGAALADHPESPDLRPHRRNRGGRDDVPAGRDRRHPELGLPVLLAPRRHPDAAGAAGRGLHGGGRRVARLAAPRRRRGPRGSADHVRTPRRTPAAGTGAALAQGL